MEVETELSAAASGDGELGAYSASVLTDLPANPEAR
jgi:hypothetical protein